MYDTVSNVGLLADRGANSRANGSASHEDRRWRRQGAADAGGRRASVALAGRGARAARADRRQRRVRGLGAGAALPALRRRGGARRPRRADQGLLDRRRGARARRGLRRQRRPGRAPRGRPAAPRPRALLPRRRPGRPGPDRDPEGRLRPGLHGARRPGGRRRAGAGRSGGGARPAPAAGVGGGRRAGPSGRDRLPARRLRPGLAPAGDPPQPRGGRRERRPGPSRGRSGPGGDAVRRPGGGAGGRPLRRRARRGGAGPARDLQGADRARPRDVAEPPPGKRGDAAARAGRGLRARGRRAGGGRPGPRHLPPRRRRDGRGALVGGLRRGRRAPEPAGRPGGHRAADRHRGGAAVRRRDPGGGRAAAGRPRGLRLHAALPRLPGRAGPRAARRGPRLPRAGGGGLPAPRHRVGDAVGALPRRGPLPVQSRGRRGAGRAGVRGRPAGDGARPRERARPAGDDDGAVLPAAGRRGAARSASGRWR